jgi:alpha-glucosidase (family GH31 glycosyl hydrolase)
VAAVKPPAVPVTPKAAVSVVASSPAPLPPAPSVPAPSHPPAASPAPVKAQPQPQPQPQQEEEEEEQGYQIDDRESSGDSGSGTDEEAEKDKAKRVPEWAKGQALREALERQFGLHGLPMDPDEIFPEVQTCSLEEIFGIREGKAGLYSKRSSSARWDIDELSLVEKRTYKSQMGFAGITPGKKTA